MIILKSFDGFTLNDSTFVTTATSTKTPPDATIAAIARTNAEAVLSGSYDLSLRSVVATIRIKNPTPALESELKEAVRPGRRGLLVGTFSDDGRDYQLDCQVQSCHPQNPYSGIYLIIFQTGEMEWKTVDGMTDSWNVTSSGDSHDLTVGGYSPTRLKLDISPTVMPAAGWKYHRLYRLYPLPGYWYSMRPWCISLDTAALVTAGKMLSSCNDVMVIIDGVVVPRWIADPNTNHTKIWFNIAFSEGQNLTLKTAIGATGSIATLDFQVTHDNILALQALPSSGILQCGYERFAYTGKDLVNYQLTGVTRNVLSSTLEAHAAADVFYWLEHTVYLIYGNSAATAPSLGDAHYDDTKPVMDLSASTNSSWVYTASTLFYDSLHPKRTGVWTPYVSRVGNDSRTYVYKASGAGEPALGMKMSVWYKNGLIQGENATLAWQMEHSSGFTSISMTGRKYKHSIAWAGVEAAALQASPDGADWTTIWYEADPTAVATWEAVVHSVAAIAAGNTLARFVLSGSLAAALSGYNYFEALTCVVNFIAANEPSEHLSPEISNYLMRLTLENDENGDAMYMTIPMQLNEHLILDSENHVATINGMEAQNIIALNDETRGVWMRLEPGTNAITISGDDIATLAIVASWWERRI